MPRTVPTEFIEWLTNQMNEHGWSIRETARAAGMSHTPISHIVSNGEQPSYETCVALANAFKVPIEEVLRMAGLLPRPPEYDPEIDELVGLFAMLDVATRRDALRIVRVLVEGRDGAKGTRAKAGEKTR